MAPTLDFPPLFVVPCQQVACLPLKEVLLSDHVQGRKSIMFQKYVILSPCKGGTAGTTAEGGGHAYH